jgi:hypothetical protein
MVARCLLITLDAIFGYMHSKKQLVGKGFIVFFVHVATFFGSFMHARLSVVDLSSSRRPVGGGRARLKRGPRGKEERNEERKKRLTNENGILKASSGGREARSE